MLRLVKWLKTNSQEVEGGRCKKGCDGSFMIILQALNEMKTVKAPGPLEVSLKLIAASGEVGIHVMTEICQKILDEFGMPGELALSIVVAIFKGKGDIRN